MPILLWGRIKRVLQKDMLNIGIISAYNDMLSAHQPFAEFPDIIKTARARGATARVAGGVPAIAMGSLKGRPGWNCPCFVM